MDFQPEAFIKDAGGVEKLRELCIENGVPAPHAVTIRMWKSRGSVPKGWATAFMLLLRKSPDKPVRMRKYLVPNSSPF